MTENIFAAGEIIEALNKRLRSELSDFICHGDCHEFIGPSADNKIREHAKAIIKVTVYKRLISTLGMCCDTCTVVGLFCEDSPTCKVIKYVRNAAFVEREVYEYRNWRPRITKATFGLEE